MLPHHIPRRAHWGKVAQIDRGSPTTLLLGLTTAPRAEHRWEQVGPGASTSPTSITRSNLDIFQLFWRHWIQLIQDYNHAFQSMWGSQRAYVDPGGRRGTTRWAVNQRSEPPQPRLLGQTLIFFNYFESIELSWFRATIMPPKVCEVVSAQKSIRAGEDAGSGAIEQLQPSISPTPFAESNLHIFPEFLNRWAGFDRLYNLRQRKFCTRGHLVGVRGRWPIDRGADGPASRMRFGGGKLSLSHLLRWSREACRK